MKNVCPNPKCSFLPESRAPNIHSTAYIHPQAVVIGDVEIGAEVMVAPFASVRADEGSPFRVGARSNIQDGVVMHALETDGDYFKKNTVEVSGKRYAIYIGEGVSLAHQCQIHGPALIQDSCFIGMQSFVFKSEIGKGSVLEPGAKVMGVNVPSGRYVPAGSIIRDQQEADDLPIIDESYPLKDLNAEVVKVNTEIDSAYKNEFE
ncbi:MAG: carbonic anhydrase [Deltaproteobacteria bacterium]|jgi:carbonic anhydrase|nr:carbonic anhydrase [Deltaproteobacteria bacterium]